MDVKILMFKSKEKNTISLSEVWVCTYRIPPRKLLCFYFFTWKTEALPPTVQGCPRKRSDWVFTVYIQFPFFYCLLFWTELLYFLFLQTPIIWGKNAKILEGLLLLYIKCFCHSTGNTATMLYKPLLCSQFAPGITSCHL